MNRSDSIKSFVGYTVLTILAVAATSGQARRARGETATEERKRALAGPYFNLEYRLIGPSAGGRVSRVAGVPGNPRICWVASSAGGVWKSTSGGLEWKSVSDELPVSSIGSLAIAPSDPNVVWVGTGEANIRGNVAEGNGIYLTQDGGTTWKHVWKAEGQIGTIIVHPADPQVAYAAVLGSPFGPGADRGVLRTTDGGQSWKKVLFVDEDTGASDVCFDPSNPRVLFAGTWQARRTPWGLTSGGAGSGLWISRDAGDSWTRLLENGLPAGVWGKVGVRVAPSDSRRVYALIEAKAGGLFRSDDGGESWKRVNRSRGLRQRAWYYTTLTVDPSNADVVWFPQVRLLKSLDGGRTVRSVKGEGWDYHDVWIDPVDPARVMTGSDAGVTLSQDGGETWVRPPLPIAQFYHISVDTRVPFHVLGSLQDFGTASAPSNTLNAAGILLSDWRPVAGGEAGYVVADPSDPDIVWAGEYLGFISRWNGRTGQGPHVGVYPDNGSGHASRDLRLRFQWTSPILISPHDHNTVYHAGNRLFRTRDGGISWEAISPDLSRNDASKQQWSGGPITGDNTGVEFFGTIFALDESPLEAGVIWAGTDDGIVHLTRDGGTAWKNVTPPDLPPFATVSCIQASRHDAASAYLIADAHRLDDESPYLWTTSNFGNSWRRLGQGKAAGGLDPETYLHVVRDDPQARGVLYLGTERGVLVSQNEGATWESLRLNMPIVSVVDLVVTGDDLVVATLGRSAWILDDLTPVRETKADALPKAPHLFPPRDAIRWFYGTDADAGQGSRAGAGSNPPAGSIITYFLPKKPKQRVTLEVLDASHQVIRKLSDKMATQYTTEDHPEWDPTTELKPDLPTKVGFNRCAWDLSYERPEWVLGTRNDAGSPAPGPQVLPGTYTLRLTVDGQEVKQVVRVKPDPRSQVPPADLQAQFQFELSLRDQLTEVTKTVGRLHSVQRQLKDLQLRLRNLPNGEGLRTECDRVLTQLTAIEDELHNRRAEVDYDVLAGRDGGAKLYSRLAWLARGASEHGGPPTQGMRQVFAELEREYDTSVDQFEKLLEGDLAAINARVAELKLDFLHPPQK